MFRRTIPTALTLAALGLAAATPGAVARHGADDPVGHERHAGHGVHHKARGADDRRRGGHRRGGHDDGPNHR
jgi:hypothetical protein